MTFARRLGPIACLLAVLLPAGCHRHSGTGRTAEQPPRGDTPPAAVPLLAVTPRAAGMVHQYAAEAGVTDRLHLRVRAVPGGCQGFMHKLDLEPDVTAEDEVFESGGVSVVVFKRQREMLRGAEVDFVEEDGRRGFKVENPNFTGSRAEELLAELRKERDVK